MIVLTHCYCLCNFVSAFMCEGIYMFIFLLLFFLRQYLISNCILSIYGLRNQQTTHLTKVSHLVFFIAVLLLIKNKKKKKKKWMPQQHLLQILRLVCMCIIIVCVYCLLIFIKCPLFACTCVCQLTFFIISFLCFNFALFCQHNTNINSNKL